MECLSLMFFLPTPLILDNSLMYYHAAYFQTNEIDAILQVRHRDAVRFRFLFQDPLPGGIEYFNGFNG